MGLERPPTLASLDRPLPDLDLLLDIQHARHLEHEPRLGDRVLDRAAGLVIQVFRVVVECKATCGLVEGNEAQVVNRLSAIRQDIGLLLNFGTDRLQFKRKTRTYVPTSRP
jgi:GxxExxY protein